MLAEDLPVFRIELDDGPFYTIIVPRELMVAGTSCFIENHPKPSFFSITNHRLPLASTFWMPPFGESFSLLPFLCQDPRISRDAETFPAKQTQFEEDRKSWLCFFEVFSQHLSWVYDQ